MIASALTPFPVDPAVLARIRPLVADDAEEVARLHAAAMGHSLWARLGTEFLCLLYRELPQLPEFIGYVYVEEGRIRGFIAGTTDGRAMMRRLWRRHWPGVLRAAGRATLREPGLAADLWRTFSYFRVSGVGGVADVPGESMFCSFEPELRGKRISGLINKVLFDELAARGHRFVKITNEADNEASIRQLTSWGFEEKGRFRFYGKEMIAWRLDLTACERVNPHERLRPESNQ